jgi:hypothetical protein
VSDIWTWDAAMRRARRAAKMYGIRTKVVGTRRPDGTYSYRSFFVESGQ